VAHFRLNVAPRPYRLHSAGMHRVVIPSPAVFWTAVRDLLFLRCGSPRISDRPLPSARLEWHLHNRSPKLLRMRSYKTNDLIPFRIRTYRKTVGGREREGRE
jgi:hypothetical protein